MAYDESGLLTSARAVLHPVSDAAPAEGNVSCHYEQDEAKQNAPGHGMAACPGAEG